MTDFSEQNLEKTGIEGLYIIRRPIFPDDRGSFNEVVRIDELNKTLGINFSPKQWNHSKSKPGVLRGLHAEGWDKIVYPAVGEMFLALADIRPDSETFGKVETFEANNDNRFALFVPNGLANSFYTTGDQESHYLYLVNDYYDGTDKKAVAWDDPDLNIDWPNKNPILSDRDKTNPKLREMFPDKFSK